MLTHPYSPPPAAEAAPTPAAQPTAEVFLELQGITKTFGGVRALRGVDLSVHAAQIYHLMGENGSGKSTLIKIVSGAQPPSSGSLTVGGQTYSHLEPIQALKLGIETVYQDLSLFPNLSVEENVALNAQLVQGDGRLGRRLNLPELRRVALAALRRVGLEPTLALLTTPVEQLPVALRQLVAIARGIATQARLVILDEPTTALTQVEVENLIGIIERLKAGGVSVVFVSHKLDEIFRIGGQLIVLRDGEKVAEGPLTDYDRTDVSELMTGKRLDQRRYRPVTVQHGNTLLEVRGLGRGSVLNDINLTLRAGEILGVTGLLDSGRNELARALAGVEPATRGTLAVAGQPARLRSPRDAIALGIGYVPEDRLTEGLFLGKPIRDNIVVSVLDRMMRGGRVDEAAASDLARRFVGDLQIATPSVDLDVGSLSGGNQQRVVVARWLATEPQVLILHGPTVGVDVGSKDALYRLIQDLAAKGMGILLISDDLPELLQNCDAVAVMRGGTIARTFDATNLDERVLSDQLFGAQDRTTEAQP